MTVGDLRTRLQGWQGGEGGGGGRVEWEVGGRVMWGELPTCLEWNLTNPIGIFPSDPLASAPGMEHNHPILGTLGVQGGQVKREI